MEKVTDSFTIPTPKFNWSWTPNVINNASRRSWLASSSGKLWERVHYLGMSPSQNVHGAVGFVLRWFGCLSHLTDGRESSATRNVVEATLLKVDIDRRELKVIRGRLQVSLANHPDPELEDVERDVTEVSVSGLVAEHQRSGSHGRPKVLLLKSKCCFAKHL